MRLFTVHLPVASGSGKPEFERAEFVRDGFHVFAFLLSVIWCLWRGLWIPALAILVLSAALLGIGRLLHLPSDTQILVQIVLAILVGLEASNLRRFGLRRRGFIDAGGVAARDLPEAEAIFFDRVALEMSRARGFAPNAMPGGTPAAPGRGAEEVIGLFPEYRGR
ncbi:MAG: DUF2628 domain-containing protein [Hyphomicrobiales bacterium]